MTTLRDGGELTTAGVWRGPFLSLVAYRCGHELPRVASGGIPPAASTALMSGVREFGRDARGTQREVRVGDAPARRVATGRHVTYWTTLRLVRFGVKAHDKNNHRARLWSAITTKGT